MLDDEESLKIKLQGKGLVTIQTQETEPEVIQIDGKDFMVLDRPNPIVGMTLEGPLLDRDLTSFVGRHSIPMQHGLTMAEMVGYLNQSMAIGAELHVVPMSGWRRPRSFAARGT